MHRFRWSRRPFVVLVFLSALLAFAPSRELLAQGAVQSVTLAPPSGPPGTIVQVVASHYPPNTQLEITLSERASVPMVTKHATTTAQGSLTTEVPIPSSANIGETLVVVARVAAPPSPTPNPSAHADFTVTAPRPSGADWAVPGGHFFTQTAGGQGGFRVVDDSQARFWSEFQRLGGLQNVGYPISQRFLYDGFVTQAFQKLVLQWRPEVGQAWPVNVFDELSEKGFDATLFRVRQTPYPLIGFDPSGATWMQIIRQRQALLDANPAIRARYFAPADPLNVYGLPVSRVEDMGNHYALRTQRAVFQQWKENVPWASAGQVTIANGGDIGKELGWLTGAYLHAEPLPQTSTVPSSGIRVEETAVEYVMAMANVNMRSGPGYQYPIISYVADGQTALVTGVSTDGKWWRILCPDDTVGNCWVSADPSLTKPTG